VHTGKVKTTVLGTAFNIKAYPGQKEIVVTVTRGKVKVSDDTKTMGIITPNESIAVNVQNNEFTQQHVNAEAVVEWKKQYLVFDDIAMEDAAVLIASKYHVDILFAKESLKACRISASFLDNENLEQVLTVVTAVVNARYAIQPNDQIIISGEGCK
jgi:ferric-dicitrate binding protein FerR (iron transport regulator)